MEITRVAGKISYGLFFCVVLPLFFIWWTIHLPEITSPELPDWIGYAVTTFGFVIMSSAMIALITKGNGLPMNAFPPTNYVTSGPYRYFDHPIYTGFCVLCAGVSLVVHSGTGLFIVTPFVALLCVALVWGYERHGIIRLFGKKFHGKLFGLPEASTEKLTVAQKAGLALAAFFPWVVLYEAIIFFGHDESYIDTVTGWESKLPVVEFTEVFYFGTYLFVGLFPFFLKTRHQGRKFVQNSWLITAIGIFIQLIIPAYATARSFTPDSFFGDVIVWERSMDGPDAAFPSFHVLWTLVALQSWIALKPRLSSLWRIIAILIIISCFTTGMHSIADIVFAIVTWMIIDNRESLIKNINWLSNRIANSWTAWQFGKMRVINHSLYAGVAAMTGTFLAMLFGIEPRVMLIISVSSAIGAALWGQWIEGSSKMLRPFGFYGAIIGGVAGIFIGRAFFEIDLMLTFGAISLAAPWTQALGRVRCMIQGCCHGRPGDATLSVVYNNEHSRVCRISGLKGKEIHNTQLYSFLMNFVIGVILLRCWYAGMSPAFITGFYFILTGCGRFVEEAFRGEVQTPVAVGLTVYQWLAIGFVIAGMLITTTPVNNYVPFQNEPGLSSVVVSVVSALVWAFGMGIDFPASSMRYSRLTG